MSLAGKKYAQALMEVAMEQKVVEEIYEQFKMIMRGLRDHRDLYEILLLPSTQTSEKKSIIEKIYKGQINGYLYNLLMVVLDKNRMEDLKLIFESYRELYYDLNKMVEANVVTVVPMTEDEKAALKAKLEQRTKKTVLLTTRIDDSIIGGMIVYLGDQVIDGSVRRKLSLLKNELKEIRLQELGVN
ncbi:ATP synthase F1 subunit delta [Alkalibacter rhizosphaerae]|uniref:ATP synthase subunit delta n=1 Tax=Alkalibacter rhizosphaerae TaxID=2815577 RepID=A0A975AIP4_9FIRM|nr:ATP synthase F1 subunit delta [Alkalibacter rhizosphaerae]QSX09308.1 ATP synthase F1 subunit delta [Alkalibacter rhizosphaerae]